MNPLRPAGPRATASAQAPQTAQTEAQRAQLRSAAEAFEAVFLRQMIGSMRQARLAEDPFGSAASEQFRDMADARLADSMAQQRSFGIAELLLAQFDRTGGAR
jgi:flagellar protein FlgJ